MKDIDILKNIPPEDLLRTAQGKGAPVFTRDFKGRVVVKGNTVIATNSYHELFTIVVDRVTPKGVKDKNGRLYHSRSIYRLDED